MCIVPIPRALSPSGGQESFFSLKNVLLSLMHKYTYKKFMGDDKYSWAVFRDGRVYTSGMTRADAKSEKEMLEREDNNIEKAAKRMVAELGHIVYTGKK